MVQIGDIVERFGERWIVAHFEQELVRLLRYEGPHLRSFAVASDVGLTVVDHPKFEVGEHVILSDLNEGTVIYDPGHGPITVQGPNRLPLRRGGFITGFAGGKCYCARAQLILDNRRLTP